MARTSRFDIPGGYFVCRIWVATAIEPIFENQNQSRRIRQRRIDLICVAEDSLYKAAPS